MTSGSHYTRRTYLIVLSCVNYLVRRLILTAEYFRRKYPVTKYGQERHVKELRNFLQSYTRYAERQVNEIVPILVRCLAAGDDEPTTHEKAKIKKRVKEHGWGCHICGISLDFTETTVTKNTATIDHLWPRSMGGTSDIDNLRVACSKCNNEHKRDHIDASDFHYEEITLPITNYGEYVSKALNREYEVAIFAKTGFTCSVCGQPASRVGELYIGRIDLNDTWHFANLTGYCEAHRSER